MNKKITPEQQAQLDFVLSESKRLKEQLDEFIREQQLPYLQNILGWICTGAVVLDIILALIFQNVYITLGVFIPVFFVPFPFLKNRWKQIKNIFKRK